MFIDRSLSIHALIAGISMVELQNGKIEIDGMNIRNMGLDVLRGRLALVPQDSTLFLGTLRDNL
jgi:ATP-binding cassette subfamily C (CFTR/MRP) protein 1